MNLPFTQRSIGILAMAAPVWFAGVYLIMSGLRPEYSHLTKAISELGSVDAPRAVVWNLLGYILPGLVIALLGLALRREFSQGVRSSVPAYALVATGLFMGLSGVFPGNFENRTSATMLLHTAGSLGSFAAFLVTGFSLPRVMRTRPSFAWAAAPSLVLVWGAIITGFFRTGAAPGLGQRLGFAFVFLWVGLIGYLMFRHTRTADPSEALPHRPQPA